MSRCEDAPCCGCCGTNIYGINQDDCHDLYCDVCGFGHVGPCPVGGDDDYYYYYGYYDEPEYEEGM